LNLWRKTTTIVSSNYLFTGARSYTPRCIEVALSGGFFALGIGAEGSLKSGHANVQDLAHMTFEKLQGLVDSHE
jgi:hypothetical protein